MSSLVTSNESFPKVSVITVAYNGGAELENTLLSVLGQNYPNLEYLVIDGGSKDQSQDILKAYDSRLDYWVSEPDAGIYDAMNKGIKNASGEWLVFMNCGDRFYSPDVLKEVFQDSISLETQIVYGNWEVRYSSTKRKLVQAGSIHQLNQGSQFCHQAALIRRNYHIARLYRTDLRLVADFEFFYQAFRTNQKFKKIQLTITSIEAGGVSDLQRIEVIKGWRSLVQKDWKTEVYYSKRLLRERLVRVIKQGLSWF